MLVGNFWGLKKCGISTLKISQVKFLWIRLSKLHCNFAENRKFCELTFSWMANNPQILEILTLENFPTIGYDTASLVFKMATHTYSLSFCTTETAVLASSPVVGSSRNSTFGSMMSSMPMLVLFLSPPDTPRINSLPIWRNQTLEDITHNKNSSTTTNNNNNNNNKQHNCY